MFRCDPFFPRRGYLLPILDTRENPPHAAGTPALMSDVAAVAAAVPRCRSDPPASSGSPSRGDRKVHRVQQTGVEQEEAAIRDERER